MRILVKVGGAQLESAASRNALARALLAARAHGHEPIVVHGGGPQILRLSERLAIEPEYRAGLRVTDEATADVVLLALAGEVNRLLVQSLDAAGVPAVGLTGADGGTFHARHHRPEGADLGYVGAVAAVNPTLVEGLLAGGFVPVIAPVAPLANATLPRFYNINADMAASALAVAFRADALLFLTDVPGVLADGELVRHVDERGLRQLHLSGAVSGGMLPKLQAALDAAQAAHAPLVKIARGTADGSENAILEALAPGHGTHIAPTEPIHG